MKYSPSKNGFYTVEIHGQNIPTDAVEITDKYYSELLASQSDGKTIQPDKTGKPIAVDPPQLTNEQLRVVKLAEINTEADQRTAMVRADVPTDEVQSWGKQEQEARALALDSKAATPLLSSIAAARGVPLNLLAQKVIEKAEAFAIYTGQIIGTRQALEDRLMAIDLTVANAAEQIAAIQWPQP